MIADASSRAACPAEDRPRFLFDDGVDAEQHHIVIAVGANRPTKDDDTSINETVSECSVFCPGSLLANATGDPSSAPSPQ